MEKHQMPTFFAELMKLAEAKGESLSERRMAIYFEDLEEFSLSQVLEAMTWARKNLNHFPSIPELRINIEGEPEANADRAWASLRNSVFIGRNETLIVHDRVLAQTIVTVWYDWPKACHTIGQAEVPYEMEEIRKTFKRAYLQAWKHRDGLPSDVRLKGSTEQAFDAERLQFSGFEPIRYRVYSLVDGNLTVIERHEIPNPEASLPRGPMPPELRERMDNLLNGLGADGTPAMDNVPRKIWDVSETQRRAEKPTYCTCNGAMAGGAYNCNVQARRLA
jgi:hypothetical protein